jgi:hypothetical protein
MSFNLICALCALLCIVCTVCKNSRGGVNRMTGLLFISRNGDGPN